MVNFLHNINLHRVAKILTIALYPAGILGMSAGAYDVGPFFIFPYRVLIPLIWILFIILFVRDRSVIDFGSNKVKAFGIFLLVWLIYSAVSIIWAVDKTEALRYVILLFLAFSVIFFSVIFLVTPTDLYVVFLLWIVVVGVTLLLGISETIFGFHLPTSAFYQTQKESYQYMPTAVYFNPNNFAAFLTLSAPFLLSMFIFSNKISLRLLSLGSFFALLYVLVSTRSRSNFLAMILVIIYFSVVVYTSLKRRKELIVMVSGFLILMVVFKDRIIAEFGSLLTSFQALPSQIANPTRSIGIRINLIRNGISYLTSTWGFGVGAGNFETWMQTRAEFATKHIINSHNWFLEVLVNFGIFIFLGYVAFYIGMVYLIYKVLHTNWENQKMRMIGVAVLGAMIAFVFASMSPSSLIAFRPHWLIFAFGLSYINLGLLRDQNVVLEEDEKG
jgi:teichuronic acid biosynthesis protein TuaE